MTTCLRPLPRVALLLALVLLAAVFAALRPAADARADTAPPSSSTPATVSSDALPTVQVNGVVWTQIVVGDVVYAGGSFTTARPAGSASGSNTSSRANLLAYRLSTGALITTFAPRFNGTVRALAASSDGATLYVGGEFTTVNSTSRSRLAAVSTASGTLVSTFAPQPNATVRALARSGSTLYAGGDFTRMGSTARTRAAAVSTAGALLAWAPVIPDGKVNALVVNSGVGKVALGGNFSGLNGRTTGYRGSGLVDSTTGSTNASWGAGSVVVNYGDNAAILSLSSDGTNVYATGFDYGAGAQGNFEGTFAASWSTGALTWLEDCHGDSYSSAPLGSAVYIAGHPHDCARVGGFPETTPRTWHRGLAFSKAATGTVGINTVSGYANFAGRPAPSLLVWFPDFNIGSYTGQNQGPWSVASSASYVVYGGEFTTVNGRAQQGLARFAVSSVAPNDDGPRFSTGDLAVTTSASGTGRTVSWRTVSDRDNTSLTYSLRRNGVEIATRTASSTFWQRPTVTVTDASPGTSPRYQVVATDPFGNSVSGATTTVAAAAAPSAARVAPPAAGREAGGAPPAAAPAPAQEAGAPVSPDGDLVAGSTPTADPPLDR